VNDILVVHLDSIDKRLLEHLDQDDEVHGPLLPSQGNRGRAPPSRELSSLGTPRCGSGEGRSGSTIPLLGSFDSQT
jgi:hypothetical protein